MTWKEADLTTHQKSESSIADSSSNDDLVSYSIVERCAVFSCLRDGQLKISWTTPGVKGFIAEDVMLSLETLCNNGLFSRVLLRPPEEQLSCCVSKVESVLLHCKAEDKTG